MPKPKPRSAQPDRSHWRTAVVRAGDDRASLEAAFERDWHTTAAERVALAWQLSVEAGRLAGW